MKNKRAGIQLYSYGRSPIGGLLSKLAVVLALSFIALIFVTFTDQRPVRAAAGINQQLNFQGRLLDSTGAVVADGSYNMEFKIYQDGDGVLGGGDETLKWTETRKQTNRVTVKNGYFSANLGSVTAFASSVDWNQDTLWLSINIGGTTDTPTPTWDGEMTPFKRLTSSPYALNTDKLDGLDSSAFGQLSANNSWSGTNLFQVTSTTALQIQNASGINIQQVDTSTDSANLVTNGSFEINTTGWVAEGSSTISRTTSSPTPYLGLGQLKVVTTAAANDGAKYAYALASTTQYTLTAFARLDSGSAAMATFQMGRADNGSTDTSCLTAQTVVTGGWTRFTCTFTTGTTSGSPYVYFKQTDAAVHTFYLDAVKLEAAAAATPYREGVQYLNGNIGSPSTFKNQSDSTAAFQIQNAAGTSNLLIADTLNSVIKVATSGSATQAGTNLFVGGAGEFSGALRIGDGTNYAQFDSTSHEVTFNGNARHTRRIALSPEYAGASMTADGASNTGTMTSDNMTSTPFRNFYKWLNTQGTAQDYDIWVRVPLPSDFAAMAATPTLSIDTYTSDTTNGTVLVTVYDTSNSADCSAVAFTPTATTTWQSKTSTTCLDTGTYAANGTITIDIKVTGAATTGDTRISDIYFDYLSKW